MQINYNQPSQYGKFAIEKTEGSEIIGLYIDEQTQLLIVEELLEANKGQKSNSIYLTTINPATGQIIPIADRKNYINYAEQEEINAELGLKRVFRRETNQLNGFESIYEQLYRVGEEAIISQSTRIAFSKEKIKNGFDSYEQGLEWARQKAKFWREEYPHKTFDEKVSYWASSFHRQMRWQGESDYDEYAIYSPQLYADCKQKEPEFDKIWKEVFIRYFIPYGWDTDEIEKRMYHILFSESK